MRHPVIRRKPNRQDGGKQVEHNSQVTPRVLHPDIRDIATPDLIPRGSIELPVEAVGDVGALDCRLLIGVWPWLFAYQVHLPHQAPDFERAHVKTVLLHQDGDRAIACGIATLCKQFIDLGTLLQAFNIDMRSHRAVFLITGAGNIKGGLLPVGCAMRNSTWP